MAAKKLIIDEQKQQEGAAISFREDFKYSPFNKGETTRAANEREAASRRVLQRSAAGGLLGNRQSMLGRARRYLLGD